jgi:hypothetical protein
MQDFRHGFLINADPSRPSVIHRKHRNKSFPYLTPVEFERVDFDEPDADEMEPFCPKPRASDVRQTVNTAGSSP